MADEMRNERTPVHSALLLLRGISTRSPTQHRLLDPAQQQQHTSFVPLKRLRTSPFRACCRPSRAVFVRTAGADDSGTLIDCSASDALSDCAASDTHARLSTLWY
ncbi:hypothetical protein PC128_g24979 [Phytophthora cactorum]|nr:hypothetical protein PC128_g24979 [Phytophthora cactorum]